MNTKECPSCAMMIDKKARECPICKYEFPTQPQSFTWIAVLLIIALLLWIIL